MNSHSYLAFDLGASSCRAILGTLQGDRMDMLEIHRFRTPLIEQGSRLYWDLDLLWRELKVGLDLALKRSENLRSLSTDSWGVDYVPLDENNQPVRPAYCYRDPRVSGMGKAVDALVPFEETYASTGIQFMEINTLYQVFADNVLEPEQIGRTKTRLMIADFFNFRFGGEAVAELSMASTTQLLKARTRTWDQDLMSRLQLAPETWPRIVPSGTIVGNVDGMESVQVIAGCSHDTACAVAAVPADAGEGEWAYLSCGTWSLLGVELDHPDLSPEACKAGFTNEAGLDDSIRFLKNLTGLWVLQECEREWKESGLDYTYDELIRSAEEVGPAGFYVDLGDDRFQFRGGMEEKIKSYCRERGQRVPLHRGELVRLVLDSMAEGHRKAIIELEAVTGKHFDIIHIVGGGSKNSLLCRLTAESCGKKVVAGPAEATALGNLLIQARTMGDLPPGTTIRDCVRSNTPLKIYE